MIKEIMKDETFLSVPAEPATRKDVNIARDLHDTLRANADHCVGMAANMIGVQKSIIIVSVGKMNMILYNPVIIKQAGPYEAEEGCLSLEGTRKTTRYREIEVEYLDEKFRKKKEKFTGKTAQIIQHEVDHTKGILI